ESKERLSPSIQLVSFDLPCATLPWGFIARMMIMSCLSLVGSVNRLSFMAAGYGSLSLYACVFVFIAVGCHLKSGEASQSALNPAGWREGGLESGEGRNKSTPKSDSNLGRGEGR
ncbi:hypothetical protein JOQ06_019689, partial [Pogonophryne albipinna]